jgi:transcriptional regulator with GAF, ATPase, and Fis domain
VGDTKTIKVNVRIIAATNRDLRRDVQAGRFREDLFYRLNVFPIDVPPLRARGRDVLLLAAAFLDRFARKMGRPLQPLSPASEQLLLAYDWPGNVRELENVLERAAILARNGAIVLEAGMFPARTREEAPPEVPSAFNVLTAGQLNAFERDNLVRALECCQWRVAGANGAAALLGMPASTVASRMKALGVERPREVS